jgi:hypothetical protein
MKKSALFSILGVVALIAFGIFLFTKKSDTKNPSTDNTQLDLPINVLPLTERPFITLSPDATGRSLNLTVSEAPAEGEMEYEMVYSASDKQEGALGSIFLESEKQPIVKSILLGSKSGGGKVTYHEGVTGGSLTVTYGETRLKENWSFLTFNTKDPSFSSVDGKLNVTLPAKGLKDGERIITMKTFGYPKTGLPESANIIVGPYGYFTASPVKGAVQVELKLPSGDHAGVILYEWDGKTWKKLTSKLSGDTVSATPAGTVFVVTQ